VSVYHKIIRSPLITEKNTEMRASDNKYVFEVDKKATKPEIKAAVEKLFNVNVVSVNTQIVKGKFKRNGRYAGYRPDRKKAIVKVHADQTISKFGEV